MANPMLERAAGPRAIHHVNRVSNIPPSVRRDLLLLKVVRTALDNPYRMPTQRRELLEEKHAQIITRLSEPIITIPGVSTAMFKIETNQ